MGGYDEMAMRARKVEGDTWHVYDPDGRRYTCGTRGTGLCQCGGWERDAWGAIVRDAEGGLVECRHLRFLRSGAVDEGTPAVLAAVA